MSQVTRREFIENLGTGVVAASLGAALATDLGLSPAFAEEGSERLTFGRLEPLVSFLQETPVQRLLPGVVQRLRDSTPLRDLVAAAALANARALGGEDYIGFHTMMALAPAWYMTSELPAARQALPVLKVLYRNTNRIQERGGARAEVLRTVQPATLPEGRPGSEVLREHTRARQMEQAERTFAALTSGTPERALEELIPVVADNAEIHRVALAYRSWDLVGILGREQAHTLLRQSVHYAVRQENPRYVQNCGGVRELVPQLLERHRLLARPLGTRTVEDSWVERTGLSLLRSTPAQAAEIVAAALAEGIQPEALGEAISLAANQLVLRDSGRPASHAQPNRPLGSVHGDSIGVHGSDAANAWRQLARISPARNKVICLLLGGYHVALDQSWRREILDRQPYPEPDAVRQVRGRESAELLSALEEALRGRDQLRATAVTARYGELGHPTRPMFDLLLKYAISEDGALHAEKYYRTVVEEFAATRPAFRWRQVIALARVTASACGQPAPGYEEARRLLQV